MQRSITQTAAYNMDFGSFRARAVGLGITRNFAACGTSIEDNVERLSGDPDASQRAKYELLLAREQAVDPLLLALANTRYGKGRPDLVDVLVGLLWRLQEDQIAVALQQHLRDDPDPRVRSRIAYKLGMNIKPEYAAAFIASLADSSSEARKHALIALGNIFDDLGDRQHEILRAEAMRNLNDSLEEVRDAALFLVEEYIGRWAQEARQLALKANVAAADSVLGQALAYAPDSKQLHYYRGRFYFEYGQRERGLGILRKNMLLIDVPALDEAPAVDGRLDESAWS